ncbi:hypothetical protein JCM10212_002197 [Sporobolomyces blumeae]
MPRDLGRSLQRTLAHLAPPPTKGGKFAMPIPSHFRSKPPFVQVKDRVPFWHVAPGDRVKLVKGDSELKGKCGTVDRVERETNRVYLKEADFSVKKRQFDEYPGQSTEPEFKGGDAQATYLVPRAFHLSNVRLQVRDGGEEYTATRVRKGPVSWDRRYRRFSWKRYALVPQLGGVEGSGDKGWRELAWPKEEVPTTQAGPLDNKAESALRTTFMPDLAGLSLAPRRSSLPHDPSKPIRIADGVPPEIALSPLDLGGSVRSRANQTARYNEKKRQEKEYGKEVMKAKRATAKKGALSDVLV